MHGVLHQSSLTFYSFNFFSATAEWNLTKFNRKQISASSSTRFDWSENQDGRPGLWLAEIFLTFLQSLNRFQWNFTGSNISTSSVWFCLADGKPRWLPGFWLADTFPATPLEQRNFTGRKCSLSSSNFVFFRPIRNKDNYPGRLSTDVAHRTQVYYMYMWPFEPLILK